MNVLVVDIGGTRVKLLASGEPTSRQFESGPALLPKLMSLRTREITEGWSYDVISIGYPWPALRNRPFADPYNLGRGWVGFNFESAFACPVKLINDAAMQAPGSYKGGKMLFLGLGTGRSWTALLSRWSLAIYLTRSTPTRITSDSEDWSAWARTSGEVALRPSSPA